MRKHPPSKWLTLAATCFGLLMLYIDLFIVNVALPTIGQDFRTPLSTVSWTISGYALMIGVLPMGIGRLGDLWGQRSVYLAGLVIFSAASFACGLAPDITVLIVFRVVQGIGAAIMTPGTLAIIVRAFPQSQHGLAIGINGGISGLGLIAGPVLGGLLVQGESWRWIFLVNIPLGIIALIMTILFIPSSHEETASVPVDWLGLALLSVGLLCLLFGVTRAGEEGWTNGVVVGSCLSGVVLLALFVITERRVRWPLIDLALFRNRQFVMGCLGFFFFSAALYGSQPYWSLFLQNTWRFSPLQGGLAFVPATGLIVLLTPVTGILAQWAKARRDVFLLGGLLLSGISFLFVTLTLSPQSTYSNGLLPAFLMRGLAIPVVTSCTTLAVVNAVSLKQSGLASGTIAMARNIGTAFGVAVLNQVYLFHVNSTLSLSSAASRAAADQFLLPAQGENVLGVETSIFQAFGLIALTCALLCGGAIILVFFMHPRMRNKVLATPAQENFSETLSNVSHGKK
ncbi:DHA2 family efflux MFS transporter permease subunit [Ktedonobacter robiniae]|uniref:MFS transporter n=1 Tax=Ktedonobacter robiniae TaxID=2778365 RepID=A0ABQ3UTH1_9CHLR|nr:DHA2 family efflux MFS transporter permease subunit [Ktedonobacter robiniae]GHO56129.1 MFS transporter [Ktedonobacter robiniae]